MTKDRLAQISKGESSGVSEDDSSDSDSCLLDSCSAAKRANPEQQQAEMMKLGDMGMGFTQEKTTPLLLLKDGGVIQVSKRPKDDVGYDRIRMHLTHVAKMFSEGNFDTPMFIHDTPPPGVPTMKKLHTEVQYVYDQIETGGKIMIAATDPKALKAVHHFLRFQFSEHQTGDRNELRMMPVQRRESQTDVSLSFKVPDLCSNCRR